MVIAFESTAQQNTPLAARAETEIEGYRMPGSPEAKVMSTTTASEPFQTIPPIAGPEGFPQNQNIQNCPTLSDSENKAPGEESNLLHAKELAKLREESAKAMESMDHWRQEYNKRVAEDKEAYKEFGTTYKLFYKSGVLRKLPKTAFAGTSMAAPFQFTAIHAVVYP